LKIKIAIAIIHLIASLTPFITSIVFYDDKYILHFAFINIIASFFILITLIIILVIVKDAQVWNMILTNNVLGFIFFIAFVYGMNSPMKFIDFQYRKDDYTEMNDIIESENIQSISLNNNRSFIKINEVKISNRDSVEIISGLDLTKFSLLDSMMYKNGVSGINKKNSIIYFTSEGFIDSEGGYASSIFDSNPHSNHAGNIKVWRKINFNWYYWYAD